MNKRLKQMTIALAAAGMAGSVAAAEGETLAFEGQQQQQPQQQQQQEPGGGAPQQDPGGGAPQQDPGAAQQPAPGAPEGEAAEVSSDELDKFASAHQEVEEIREEYMADAGDATDPDAMADIQMSMQQEMVEVVEDAGLDVGTYNRIAQMLPYDDELRERLEDRL